MSAFHKYLALFLQQSLDLEPGLVGTIAVDTESSNGQRRFTANNGRIHRLDHHYTLIKLRPREPAGLAVPSTQETSMIPLDPLVQYYFEGSSVHQPKIAAV